MSNFGLTPVQAGEILGVHWTTVNRWADAGRIPCQKSPGGWRRYRKEDVDAFAESLVKPATEAQA